MSNLDRYAQLESERARDEQRRRAKGIPSRRVAGAQKRAAKAAAGSDGGRTVLVSGHCRKCGQIFTTRCTIGTLASFCSPRCKGKGRAQAHRNRRRARERGGPRIHWTTVGHRDGWRCALCGLWVDRRRNHPDPMSPSVDHVVPLALGGPHIMSNVQLAHLHCNIEKGAGGRLP